MAQHAITEKSQRLGATAATLASSGFAKTNKPRAHAAPIHDEVGVAGRDGTRRARYDGATANQVKAWDAKPPA
jgi:hypothetical protein